MIHHWPQRSKSVGCCSKYRGESTGIRQVRFGTTTIDRSNLPRWSAKYDKEINKPVPSKSASPSDAEGGSGLKTQPITPVSPTVKTQPTNPVSVIQSEPGNVLNRPRGDVLETTRRSNRDTGNRDPTRLHDHSPPARSQSDSWWCRGKAVSTDSVVELGRRIESKRRKFSTRRMVLATKAIRSL